jgi:hypothetical protein
MLKRAAEIEGRTLRIVYFSARKAGAARLIKLRPLRLRWKLEPFEELTRLYWKSKPSETDRADPARLVFEAKVHEVSKRVHPQVCGTKNKFLKNNF